METELARCLSIILEPEVTMTILIVPSRLRDRRKPSVPQRDRARSSPECRDRVRYGDGEGVASGMGLFGLVEAGVVGSFVL